MDHFHIYDNSTKAKKTKPSARLANITSSISPLLFVFFIQNFFFCYLDVYVSMHKSTTFCCSKSGLISQLHVPKHAHQIFSVLKKATKY